MLQQVTAPTRKFYNTFLIHEDGANYPAMVCGLLMLSNVLAMRLVTLASAHNTEWSMCHDIPSLIQDLRTDLVVAVVLAAVHARPASNHGLAGGHDGGRLQEATQ